MDADGVALAAIQGLNLQVAEDARRKDAVIAALQARLELLERRLNQFTSTQGNDR